MGDMFPRLCVLMSVLLGASAVRAAPDAPARDETAEAGEAAGLVRVAETGDWPMQAEAFARLGDLGDPTSAVPLRALARDNARGDWERGEAMVTLGRLRREGDLDQEEAEATAALARSWASRSSHSSELRSAGLDYLGMVRDDGAWPLVRSALKDTDERVKRAAIRAAARLGGEEGWRVVREAAGDEAAAVRKMGIDALTLVDPADAPELEDVLVAGASDENRAVSLAAAAMVRERPTSAAVLPLFEMLTRAGEEPGVKVAYERTLRGLDASVLVPPLLRLLEGEPTDLRVRQWKEALSLLLEKPTNEAAAAVAARLAVFAQADPNELLPPALTLLAEVGGPPAAAAAEYVTVHHGPTARAAVRAVTRAEGIDVWQAFQPLLENPTPQIDTVARGSAVEALEQSLGQPRGGLVDYLRGPLTSGDAGQFEAAMGLAVSKLSRSGGGSDSAAVDQMVQLLTARLYADARGNGGGESSEARQQMTLAAIESLAGRREVVAILSKDGRPRPWYVAGPIQDKRRNMNSLLNDPVFAESPESVAIAGKVVRDDSPLIPEAGQELKQPQDRVLWTTFPLLSLDEEVSLREPLPKPERTMSSKSPAAAVVVTRVVSEREQAAWVELRTRGQARLWLNGTEIEGFTNREASNSETHRQKASLKPGLNTLVVKVVSESEKRWGLGIRLTDEGGEPLTGISGEDVVGE